MHSNRPPKLSVAVPVFNGERFLTRTIESILSQSFGDFELLISDNCSTDATREISERFVSADRRVRYQCNPRNVGAPENYNVALRLSKGEFFKWSSASDICGPELFARCIETLEAERDVVLAFPQTRLFELNVEDSREYDDRMNLMQPSAYERFVALLANLRLNNVMNGVIRRSVLAQIRPFRRFLSSDVIVMVELALRGKFKEVDGATFFRRMSPETTAGQRTQEDLLKHWDPQRTSPLGFQHWKYLIALGDATMRVRPGVKDTALLTVHLLRQVVWGRRELLGEVLSAAHQHRPAH